MSGRQYASRALDVFPVDVHLATGPKGWKRLRRTVRFVDKGVPESAGLTQFGLFVPDRGTPRGHLVLWVELEGHDDPAELVDTCAHEATHGAGAILDWLGHSVHPAGGDEPHAHLVGWLTRWLWTSCQELREQA